MATPPVIPPTFWSTQNLAPPQPVSQPTPGTVPNVPLPVTAIPGGAQGNDPAQIRQGRDRVFPLLTGAPGDPARTIVPKPAEFNLPADQLPVAEFRRWHTALQTEYILKEAIRTGGNPAQQQVLAIGPNQTQADLDQQLHVVLMPANAAAPQEPRKLLILNDLDKRAIAKLSRAEQLAVVSSPFYMTRLAPALGLVPAAQANPPSPIGPPPFDKLSWPLPDPAIQPPPPPENVDLSTPAGVARAVERLVNTLIQDIIIRPPWDERFFTIDRTTGQIAPKLVNGVPNGPTPDIPLMTAADQQQFLDQLVNLRERLKDNVIMSPNDIGTALQEIQTRWNRAAAFGQVEASLSDRISDEGGSPPTSIVLGFQTFMNAERQLLALDNQRLALARSGQVGQRNLDAPSLIAQFQAAYNGRIEARLNGDAQEITQFNNLLKMYATYQALLNRTVAKFNPSDNGQLLGLDGNGAIPGSVNGTSTPLARLSAGDQAIIKVFDGGPFATDPASRKQHPIENLYKIARPFGPLLDGNRELQQLTRSVWEGQNSSVSDRVTIINQQSQINSNNINSLDRQKNRHFDLANSALTKLNETLQSIGRNVA